MGAWRAASSAGSGRPAQAGDGALHRQHCGRSDVEDLPAPAVEPARRAHGAIAGGRVDGDQPEGLGGAQLGGEVGRDGAGATIGRRVAAHDPRRFGGDRGDRRGHGVARQAVRCVDADSPRRAGGDGLAQGVFGRRLTDGHDRHLVPALLGEAQGGLQRGPVGIGDARPPLVPVDGDPLPADDDHERRNTTPWPPSGYDQEIAPSLLHTR